MPKHQNEALVAAAPDPLSWWWDLTGQKEPPSGILKTDPSRDPGEIMAEYDKEALTQEVGKHLSELLGDLMEGDQADLRGFSVDMTRQLLDADEGDLAQLADQAKVLAEAYRLRTMSTIWPVVERVIPIVVKIAMAGVAAAVV